MATRQSTKAQTKAEKLTRQYYERLPEIKSFLKKTLKKMSLKGVEELCNELELEMNAVDNEEVSILSLEIRAAIKAQYQTIIERYRNVVREVHPLNELMNLNNLKAPINKSQETTFERQIYTARQELEKLKLSETIDSYNKHVLIKLFETELERLDKEVTDQFLNVEVRALT